MTESCTELLQIAETMEQWAARGRQEDIWQPLEQLKKAAEEVGKAWSGSWLGYQAFVYYRFFSPRPAGKHFSKDMGLMQSSFGASDTIGDWVEFNEENIVQEIYSRAGNTDIEPARTFHYEASRAFHRQRLNVLSILESEAQNSDGTFLENLKKEIEDLSVLTEREILSFLQPRQPRQTQDYQALEQGICNPPHLSIIARVQMIQHTVVVVRALAEFAKHAATHLSRQQRQRRVNGVVGSNVFIGHGHSQIWRELKDFIEDRLGLPVDEFDGVPTAGASITDRLSKMLDDAAFAFLILTGEDEQPGGKRRARMNVIHEVGLFQGRLGFNRAIVLLEEGCEKFSNIDGLIYIAFPNSHIRSAFEEIRMVLEREEVLTTGA